MARPTAVITGGSGGIGSACVSAFGTDHDVAIQYHSNRDGAQAAAESVAGETMIRQADFAEPSEIATFVDDVEERFGGIDVLVNNAAVFFQTDVLEMDRDRISTTLGVNLEGTIHCTRFALPHIISDNGGWIVNIASTAGIRGSPTDPVYGASKGGVIAFTKSLARQFTADGVFANAVAPGPTKTPMFAEERRPAKRDSSPIGRLVTPDEVAEAVRFFADTESISGRILTIDGGDR